MVEYLRNVLFWPTLQTEKELEQIIARIHFVMYLASFKVKCVFINDAISLDFCSQIFPLIFLY